MARANGKKIIRTTEILTAILLVVSGIASLLAWGTNGYIDWSFGNWRNATSEELPVTPDDNPDDEEPQNYAFAVSSRTVSANPREASSGAEAEFNTYLQGDSRRQDITVEHISKITVKNNIDGQTISGAEAGIKVISDNITMNVVAVLPPRVNPFGHLQGYRYKITYCKMTVNGGQIVNKPNMYTKTFEYWDFFFDMSFSAAEITYELEEDPNTVQPLPEAPKKEGYTFTGWYYGTDEEHGENCTKYIGETVTSNINLHAHFEINRFTVTFDANGGNAIENQIVDWNTSITPATPEHRGYEFKGWFLSDGTEYTGQAITEDITLTARWEIKTFIVTFYVGGEVYATKQVDYGTTFAELAEGTLFLRLGSLSVVTETGEIDFDNMADTPITSDYIVMAQKLTVRQMTVKVLQKYPWIIFAAGAGLSVLIGITGAVLYAKQSKPTRRRKR